MLDVCIIGFGFSAIPLVRELERTGTDFKIISEEDGSIWDRLSKTGRLDFNLVSSYQSSFYSFDLVKDYDDDYYPTSKQFYEMHKRWHQVYEEKIIRDFAIKVDNFKDYSVIHTREGQTIRARHVVIATGFGRAMNTKINDFNFNVSNQTFVFGTMGDSANLLIAKLIPNNNKIIIRMNGFNVLDQQVNIAGKKFTLDQLEFHNCRYISNKLYDSIITSPIFPKSENPAILYNQFPLIKRDTSWVTSKSAPPNGLVFLKYWPIDQYCQNFGTDLEDSISKGYLLNDISMWIHTGKVIIVPPDTPIDFDKKTITYAGVERSFSHYVKGDAEQPRLPEIFIGGEQSYTYQYRDNFMGVLPRSLHNIYLLGFTRPLTGGLANIVEMQSLLIHKLVTQSNFHRTIHQNLNDRITSYNLHHYGSTPSRKTDHTTQYGVYTDDIARLIGIDHKLSDCNSLKDLIFYYAFPNNAYKYRLKGEYAVEGIEALIEKINKNHDYFILIFSFMLKAGCIEMDKIPDWVHSTDRFFFNDMRHKEKYIEFLDAYFSAYHRVKGITIEDILDDNWDSMASEARKVRDFVAAHIEEDPQHQLDMDLFTEVQLVSSLLDLDLSLLLDSNNEYDSYRLKLELGPERVAFLQSMLEPQEYELPHLSAQARSDLQVVVG